MPILLARLTSLHCCWITFILLSVVWVFLTSFLLPSWFFRACWLRLSRFSRLVDFFLLLTSRYRALALASSFKCTSNRTKSFQLWCTSQGLLVHLLQYPFEFPVVKKKQCILVHFDLTPTGSIIPVYILGGIIVSSIIAWTIPIL